MSSGEIIDRLHQCRLTRSRIEDMNRVRDRLLGAVEVYEVSRFQNNPEDRIEFFNTMLQIARQLRRRSRSLRLMRMPGDSNDGFEYVNGDSENNDDTYTRFGLNESIERASIEAQSSLPAPSPRSAIDDMLTIRITPTHIATGLHSHCPVCKDRFELGTEARQTPCNHIYHSGCITPWLLRHNTCPVCRHKLGSRPINCRPRSRRRNTSSNSREGGTIIRTQAGGIHN